MENQSHQQFFNLFDQMVRQVAREEVLLFLKGQSNLVDSKCLLQNDSAKGIHTLSNEYKSSVKWLLPYEGIDIFHTVLVEQEKLLCSVEDFRSIFIASDAA